MPVPAGKRVGGPSADPRSLLPGLSELDARKPGDLIGVIANAMMQAMPDVLRGARERFVRENPSLLRISGGGLSDPAMAMEFGMWLCTEFIIEDEGQTPVEWFRETFDPVLDDGVRSMAQALLKSPHSIFEVVERKGKDYRVVDCRTENEYRVRTIDMAPLKEGTAVLARLVRNVDTDDGTYHFQGAAVPLPIESASKCRQELAPGRETVTILRRAFIEHFGRCDPVFPSGKDAMERLYDFQMAHSRRMAKERGFPEPGEGEIRKLMGFDLEANGEIEPLALMFEIDGLIISRCYPDVLTALDGSMGDEKMRDGIINEVVDDCGILSITTLRRLFEQFGPTVVKTLSKSHPEVSSFGDVKRLVERKRCEPFDLVPAPHVRQKARIPREADE